MAYDDDDPMTHEGRHRHRRAFRALLVLALVIGGVVLGFLWGERRPLHRVGSAGPITTTPQAPEAAPPQADEPVDVTLTHDVMKRAGIKTANVRTSSATAAMTIPATVASNAYRETRVNALVGGVVRQVEAELGASVRQGQTLAVVFSTDLAEAQMKYLSMRAMLEADHQKLERTRELVTIGAASRQELEEVTAIHTGHETEVAATRQRLLLLGMSSSQVAQVVDASHIVSELIVTAPADGIVISRSVNPGQVVNAGQDLFVVTDLRTVWVIGDLYEKDFAAVAVGSDVAVSIPATPGRTLRGRVAYIDPRVDPSTRTAKVRVEVPNSDGALRLGMYVTLAFQVAAGERMTLVPRAAVQTMGDRAVVYVPVDGEEGRFSERPVKLGQSVGDSIQVLDGLKPGERVVTTGSFFLRAEAARARSGG